MAENLRQDDFVSNEIPEDAVDTFGPGSGPESEPVISNFFKDATEDSTAPDELQALFAEHGLGERSYQCMLKQKNAGGANAAVIKGFTNEYPTLDFITKNYGPGEYVLVFMWRTKVPGNSKKSENHNARIDIVISEKCKDIYLEYQLAQRLERMKKNRQMIADAKLEKMLELEANDIDGLNEGKTPPMPQQHPIDINKEAKKHVETVLELGRQLGLVPLSQINQPPQKSGMDWEKLLPALIPVIPAAIKFMVDAQASRASKERENMLLMIEMMKSSNTQMIEVMRANQGPTNGQQAVKEFSDMIKQAFNIKQMFEGEKEGIADKVFKLIENVAPHILPVLTMGPMQRSMDPRYMIAQSYAQNSPDIAALKSNPLELRKLISNMDESLGWEQTDQILALMTKGEVQRPDDCPRDPQQRFPQGYTPEGAGEEEAAAASQ